MLSPALTLSEIEGKDANLLLVSPAQRDDPIEMWEAGYEMPDTRYRIRDSGCMICDTRYPLPDKEYKMSWKLKLRTS